MAGTVRRRSGPDVDEFKIGQRVVAFIGGNGCREKVGHQGKECSSHPGRCKR